MRAASQNQVVARLMGVSITRSFAIAWGMGGLAGGLAGILVAQGDMPGAVQQLREAAKSRDPEVARLAAAALQRLGER